MNGKPIGPQTVGTGTITIKATFFDDGQCQTRIDFEEIKGGWQTVEDILIGNLQMAHSRAKEQAAQLAQQDKRIQIAHSIPPLREV